MTNDFQWTFRPIGSTGEFEREWGEFNARTLRTPLLDAEFVRHALLHFGNGGERLAIATDGHGIAAMCLLRMRQHAVIETFQPSQLSLCPWLQRADVDLSGLAGSLVHDHAGPIVLAAITQLDPQFVARPADGSLLKAVPYITTGTIEIHDSLEHYMANRSGNLLANLRRRQRNVEHEFGSVSLQVIDSAEDIEAGLLLYSHLESAGWKANVGTAIERGNRQWHFYVDAMMTLSRQKRGQIFVLRFGDQLAAVAFAIVHESIAYMLKTTHNEHLRTYSPGVFLRREVIAALQRQEPRIGRIEMCGPLVAIQKPWITGTREMYHVNAYRSQTIAGLHVFSKHLRTSLGDENSNATPRTPPRQPAESVLSHVINRFEALPQRARTTLGRDEAREVFYSLDWFELLASEVFAEVASQRLLYAATERSGALAQMLLPMISIPARPRWYATRRLQSLANYYSSLFGPISARAASEDLEPLTLGIAALIAGSRPAWDVVDLHPLDVRSAFWEVIQHGLRKDGFWTDTYYCFGNWYLPVRASTFGEYLAGRPSQLKNSLNRGSKHIFMDPTANLTIVTEPGPELQQAIEAYELTYERSWKYSEPYPKFIPRLCQLAARKGWLRLGILRIGDRPMAAQVWLVKDGKASIYKLAYDQQFAKLSPGTVLTAALMKHAIEVDKVSEVDYLAGDDAYKRGWMSHRRKRCGIVAFNPRTVWGLVHAAIHYGGRIVQASRRRLKLMRNTDRPDVASDDRTNSAGSAKPRTAT